MATKKYRFRLAGAPLDVAEKEIEVDPDYTVGQVKEMIRQAFQLPANLHVELIWEEDPEGAEEVASPPEDS